MSGHDWLCHGSRSWIFKILFIFKHRHFPGELLSVKASAVNACPGLFHLNERVSWIGNWQHGFFSMTAVGATNVGSIHMDNEKNIGEANKSRITF